MKHKTVRLRDNVLPLEVGVRDLNQGLLPLPLEVTDFKLQSDTVGGIREVFLGLNSPSFIPAQVSLMKQMDSDVRFTIFTGTRLGKDAVKRLINQSRIENPSRIKIHDVGGGISGWLRNYVTVLSSQVGPVLVPGMGDAAKMVDKIMGADKRFVRLRKEDLSLIPQHHMGDIIASADKTFANAFTLGDSRGRERLAEFLGGGLVFVGDTLRRKAKGFDLGELGDLDMWFAAGPPTLRGGRLIDKTVFIADPLKAVKVLEGMDKQEFRDFQNRVLRMWWVKGPDDEFYQRFMKYLTKERILEENEPIASTLEGVSSEMRDRGFDVSGVPFLSLMDGRTHLTYCNSLSETFIRPKNITVNNRYMPVYGIKQLDAEASKTYESKGYDVRRVKGLSQLLDQGGSLRCITVVSDRGPYLAAG